MSGFEVVGVLLGAVPLIVSSLESYKDLNRKRDLFFKRSLHIGRMINALTEQQILIEGDVEVLLRNADIDGEILEEIKAGNGSVLLKENDIGEEVRALLGAKRYDTYVQTLSTCEETLFRIAKEIGRFKQGPWVDNGSLEEMLRINNQVAGHEYQKRWKFTMGKDDLEESILELDRSTTMLRRLRVLSLTVNQQILQSSSRRSTKMIRFLQNVRNRANSLYSAIASTWVNPCHDDHSARLNLDNRLSVFDSSMKDRVPKKSPAINFNVMFEASELSGKSFHHTSVIEVFDGDDWNSPASNNRITFQLPTSPMSFTDLEDICQAISATDTTSKALKLYLHHDHKLRYPDSTVIATKTIYSRDYVSLADLIKSSTTRLSLKQRVLIAATIASSMMQLHSTPWLKGFRKESFLFQQKAIAGQGYHLEQPVICCSFTNGGLAYQISPRKTPEELLDLGILIIELWRNQTIEDFCAANNIKLLDAYDCRQGVARRWLNDEEGEFVPLVFEAAVRCVECRFNCVNFDLNDESVRRLVFEGVIKPLWENCRV